MKRNVALVSLLLATLSLHAQSNYSITTLETLGGASGQALSINHRGWAVGAANLSGDEFSHAVLWTNGSKLDLGTLGGQNSGVFWPVHNDNGLIVGISET